jgi:hypothetical protein
VLPRYFWARAYFCGTRLMCTIGGKGPLILMARVLRAGHALNRNLRYQVNIENSKTTGGEVGWVGESVGCLSAGVTSPLLQRPFRLRKLNSL